MVDQQPPTAKRRSPTRLVVQVVLSLALVGWDGRCWSEHHWPCREGRACARASPSAETWPTATAEPTAFTTSARFTTAGPL